MPSKRRVVVMVSAGLVSAGLVSGTFLLACGLLDLGDLSEGSGRRDEMTGFVDGAGIEVCYDGLKVVSSSQAKNGPLSVCLRVGDTAKSCLNGEVCSVGEICECGRCTTRPCRTSAECGNGEACQSNRCASSCADDRDCHVGERCSAGGCARICDGDAGCAFGERCSSFDRTCVVKLCGEVVACSGEDVCVQQQRVADLHDPHAMITEHRRVAYVEVRGDIAAPNDCAIFRARIVGRNNGDARRWVVEPTTAVLVPGDDDGGCLGGPSAIQEGGKLMLYASRGDGSGIVRASSKDGVVFERDEGFIFEASAAWEKGWVGSPGVALWSGGVVMLYEGGPGAGVGIAMVEPSQAVRVANEPWLAPHVFEDPVYWRGIERVGSPYALVRDGVLYAYVTVRGTEGSDALARSGEVYPADVNDSIGLAATRDLRAVDVFGAGPVFARRTNLRAYLGESEPAVLVDGGGSWLMYVSSDASGQQRMGLGMALSGL